MKFLIHVFVLMAFAFSSHANAEDIEYIGSFTNERFTEEHYYLSEIWLWKKESKIFGVFLEYGGLGGDGPVKPMAAKIENSSSGANSAFEFTASGFHFVGVFTSNTISGNLTNGSENWDGGREKTIFSAGTNIKTIVNPGKNIKTFQHWQQWVNTVVNTQ